jgi:hypothetical protein
MLVKRKMTALTEKIPVVSQQNTANHSTLLWDKPISYNCIGDTPSEKNKWTMKQVLI